MKLIYLNIIWQFVNFNTPPQLDPISFPVPRYILAFFVVPTRKGPMGGETFEVGGLRVSSFLLALPHLLDDLERLVWYVEL